MRVHSSSPPSELVQEEHSLEDRCAQHSHIQINTKDLVDSAGSDSSNDLADSAGIVARIRIPLPGTPESAKLFPSLY